MTFHQFKIAKLPPPSMDFVKSKFHDIQNFSIDGDLTYHGTSLENDNLKINNTTYTLADAIFYLQNYKDYNRYISLCKEKNLTPIAFFDTYTLIEGIEHDLDFYFEDPLLKYNVNCDFGFLNSILKSSKKILVTSSLGFKINIGNFYKVFVDYEYANSGFEQVLGAERCFVKNGVRFELTHTASEDVVACVNCSYGNVPSYLVRFRDERVSLKGNRVTEVVIKDNVKDAVKKVWGRIFRSMNL